MISWKKTGLDSIDTEIKKIEHEILEAEITKDLNNTGTITYTGLTALYNKLSALQRQNSITWAQRARLCGFNVMITIPPSFIMLFVFIIMLIPSCILQTLMEIVLQIGMVLKAHLLIFL